MDFDDKSSLEKMTLGSKIRDSSEPGLSRMTGSKAQVAVKKNVVRLVTTIDFKRMEPFVYLCQQVNQATCVWEAMLPVLSHIT
jgi:hypothetical protein